MVPEAYILVGGLSSRFVGRDKPSARFNGKALVENAVDIESSALPDSRVFIVARDSDQFIGDIGRSGVCRIQDRIRGRGPLGGLFTALANCGSEWLFLFACDLPLMSPEFISAMLPLCDPRYGCVVPRQPDGRLQPLCAFYNVAEVFPVVENLLHRPDGSASMMSAVDALEARIVEPEEITADPWIWSNVNTTEDLAAASEIERKLSGRGEI